eukprot:TRINITY_DN22557_c0_g1_i1.p1 TRINITY_DN22557_c0_g1~~TRINITY_DN22557_c0_g1_i1.p1  ORF type:complete len:360 (+),score=55.82 TRINITY_DN22557_c0_g1_i1:59-1138(+)
MCGRLELEEQQTVLTSFQHSRTLFSALRTSASANCVWSTELGGKSSILGILKASPMETFLAASEAGWKTIRERNEEVFVILGNEACDLDSIASSLLYGLYIHSRNSNGKFLAATVINIPREDLPLRTEAAWIFSEIGIRSEHMLFFPEVERDLDALSKKNLLRLILTDHNVLAASQSRFSKDVVEIVDHHRDEGLYSIPSDKRTIELVGSATTLVARKMMNWLETSNASDKEALCRLIAGTVLLDAVNLDPNMKRVTPADIEVVDKISQLAGYTKEFKDQLFNRLQDERFDQSKLKSEELLRVDYKQFALGDTEIGVSATKVPVKTWLQKDPDVVNKMETYRTAKKLDLPFVMTAPPRT